MIFRQRGFVGIGRISTGIRALSSSYVFDEAISLIPQHTGTNSSYFKKEFLTNKFSIGDAPNGGMLMSMAIEAASKCLPDHPDPLSMTAIFMNKALEHKDGELEVRVLNSSRTTSTAEVTLSQENQMKVKFIGIFGKLNSFKGLTKLDNVPPALPPRSECFDANKQIRKLFNDKLNISNTFELFLPRNDPFATSVMQGKTGDKASISGYVKFRDDRTVTDSKALAFFGDALPPPIIAVSPSNWIPTHEYTCHFWSNGEGIAPSSWLRVTFSTTHVENGLLYCDGSIWNEEGTKLLATTRQHARHLVPRK